MARGAARGTNEKGRARAPTTPRARDGDGARDARELTPETDRMPNVATTTTTTTSSARGSDGRRRERRDWDFSARSVRRSSETR